MEVLLAFVTHQNSILQSPTSVQATQSLSKETEPGTLQNWNWNKGSLETSQSNSMSSMRTDGDSEETICLRTKFDLEIELDNIVIRVLSIKCHGRGASTSCIQPKYSSLNTSTALSSAMSPFQQQDYLFRYRILPDWQTSYLWYDVTWPQNPRDSYMVEWDDIEARYPDLSSYYSHWVDTMEKDFELEFLSGCDPSKSPMTDTQLIAWEVGGFLMACWLVFQPGVHSVLFEPFGGKYDISRETMNGECERFLRDKRAFLSGKDG